MLDVSVIDDVDLLSPLSLSDIVSAKAATPKKPAVKASLIDAFDEAQQLADEELL